MIQNARLPTRESDSQEVSASGGRRLRGVSPPRGHPRMRGEHSMYGKREVSRLGSSPHARGAPPSLPPLATLGEDHPRMRGEHSPSASTFTR